MKKLFLLFATATLLIGFQACKQKEEAAATESTEVVATDESAAVTGDSTAVAAEDDSDGTRGVKNPPPVGP